MKLKLMGFPGDSVLSHKFGITIHGVYKSGVRAGINHTGGCIFQWTNARLIFSRQFHMSRVVRKLVFCICENKDADQLRGNRIVHSLYFLLSNFKPLAIFCGCTAWFVSDLVGNLEDRFSHNEAHIIVFSLFSTGLRRQLGSDGFYKYAWTDHSPVTFTSW